MVKAGIVVKDTKQKNSNAGERETACGYYDSPAGLLRIVAGERGVREISFCAEAGEVTKGSASLCIRKAVKQLRAYFAGELREFTLRLDLQGTDFQLAVWRELLKIPYGETRTYGEIAEALGKKGAQRAVGMANNKNPVAVAVPCHRVIGKDGSLTGYAGGLEVKRYLLALEAAAGRRGRREK